MDEKKVKVLEVAALDVTVYFLLLPLMKKLRNCGYEVEASCAKGNFFGKITDEGFKVHDVPISRNLNFFKHFVSVFRLVKLIKREKIDIVHVHTPIGAFVGRIAAYFAGVTTVIYTIHGFYFHENMNFFKRRIIIYVEKVLARFTSFAFSQSDEDTQTAIRERIFPPKKIMTIGNGINVNFFSRKNIPESMKSMKRREFDLPENAIVVTCVARMVKEKGIFDLIKVAEHVITLLSNIYFVFVGEISDNCGKDVICKEFLRDYFKKHPASQSRFRFLGIRTDIREILFTSDIFVLPSYREGMPRSILEAMAMELPVIATDIRGCREEVLSGKTGILVSPGDVEALGEAIIKLAENEKLRKDMGFNGRKRVEKHFNESAVIEKQIAVMEKLFYGKSGK